MPLVCDFKQLRCPTALNTHAERKRQFGPLSNLSPNIELRPGDRDFWRSSNSLQLDETIALYVGRLFDREEIVGLVNKMHPVVPASTMEAGFRLMLHGLVDRRAEQSHSTRF